MQSFYVDSMACVRIGTDVSEWFSVNIGLRRLCDISMFNVDKDGVVREVNAIVLGKEPEMLSVNGSRFEKNQLLFADDIALVADSEDKLRRLSEFGTLYERRKFTVNVGKSKVM